MTESGLERSGEHAESCTSFLAKRLPRSEATRELVLENEAPREMTESGLERSGKRLSVALHSTKWILEGGAGGRTGKVYPGRFRHAEMTESGSELAESG